MELDDLRRSFTSEQEEKERSYTAKMSQLTAQLQQLDAVVAQVPKTLTHTSIFLCVSAHVHMSLFPSLDKFYSNTILIYILVL